VPGAADLAAAIATLAASTGIAPGRTMTIATREASALVGRSPSTLATLSERHTTAAAASASASCVVGSTRCLSAKRSAATPAHAVGSAADARSDPGWLPSDSESRRMEHSSATETTIALLPADGLVAEAAAAAAAAIEGSALCLAAEVAAAPSIEAVTDAVALGATLDTAEPASEPSRASTDLAPEPCEAPAGVAAGARLKPEAPAGMFGEALRARPGGQDLGWADPVSPPRLESWEDACPSWEAADTEAAIGDAASAVCRPTVAITAAMRFTPPRAPTSDCRSLPETASTPPAAAAEAHPSSPAPVPPPLTHPPSPAPPVPELARPLSLGLRLTLVLRPVPALADPLRAPVAAPADPPDEATAAAGAVVGEPADAPEAPLPSTPEASVEAATVARRLKAPALGLPQS
jgi:hypothetical protein